MTVPEGSPGRRRTKVYEGEVVDRRRGVGLIR